MPIVLSGALSLVESGSSSPSPFQGSQRLRLPSGSTLPSHNYVALSISALGRVIPWYNPYETEIIPSGLARGNFRFWGRAYAVVGVNVPGHRPRFGEVSLYDANQVIWSFSGIPSPAQLFISVDVLVSPLQQYTLAMSLISLS